MSIYDYDIPTIMANNASPQYRLPKWLSFIISLLSPLQWLRDNFFIDYADGSLNSFYDAITAYNKGDRVIDDDNAVYELHSTTATGVKPSLNFNEKDPNAPWIKVCDDFRGLRERVKYTGQKLTLEWVLNKFFRTTFRQPDDAVSPTNSDIWIQENPIVSNFFLIQDAAAGSLVEDDNNQFVQDFISDDNSNTNFIFRTIWVPAAVFAAAPINGDEKVIRSIVDRYNIAGVLYQILTY